MQWYEWALSGIGCTIVSVIAGLVFNGGKKYQKQKLGNNSVGIQSGRDTNIKL